MIVVLVVSSEGRISRHVRSVLGSQGWWVTSASDREEALRASADHEPALVIVDCEVDGATELVRTFGARNGGPGVLLLEPQGDTDGAFHAFEAGADQILSKPPRARQLLEAAERVMSLPHQSAGALAADMGEKLSAAEIFGEVLMELDATESGTAPVREAALAEPASGPEPEQEIPAQSEESVEAELPRDEDVVEFFRDPGNEPEEPAVFEEHAPRLEGPDLAEVAEVAEMPEAAEADVVEAHAEPEAPELAEAAEADEVEVQAEPEAPQVAEADEAVGLEGPDLAEVAEVAEMAEAAEVAEADEVEAHAGTEAPELAEAAEVEVEVEAEGEEDTRTESAEPEGIEEEMPATESWKDIELPGPAEETGADEAVAAFASLPDPEVVPEAAVEALAVAGTEPEPEVAHVLGGAAAKVVESEVGEIREISSATFDPTVLGAEIDRIEMESESGAAEEPASVDEEPVALAEARFFEEVSPAEAEGEALEEAGVHSRAGLEEATGTGSDSEGPPTVSEEEEFSKAPEIAQFADLGEPLESVEPPEEIELAEVVEPAPSEAQPPERHTPVEGDEGRFGQYRLDERIAVGGMAEVWRASMLGMEGFRKTVAIKKILPHLAENSDFVAMFIEEAKLAAQLSHENLVEIYDLGKIGESFFIAMEYVDGKDLRALMNRLQRSSDQMPIGLALLIGAEVARGLEYAHTREDSEGRALGLVHRDVSPRNVLIGLDGRVRLCDFGVAKAVSSVIQTQIGALKGKLQYMSPEQASGRSVDNRSDIYSLGSVMYEMITARRLYEADNEISLLDAVRAGNFDDPRKHCPGLPQEVRRILIKALAKKPSARYQHAGVLEQDLRDLLRTLEPAPGEQTLSAFVRELLAEPVAAQAPADDGGTVASAISSALEEPDAATRSFQTHGPLTGSKVARFWWGVAAGLLAAGVVATLLKLLLS
ncbi:MAG: protein kinase [bacterium]|nr:protein kinase [bacterium]